MEFREVDMERIGETLRYGAIEGALEDEIDELPAAFGYGGAEACA